MHALKLTNMYLTPVKAGSLRTLTQKKHFSKVAFDLRVESLFFRTDRDCHVWCKFCYWMRCDLIEMALYKSLMYVCMYFKLVTRVGLP